MKSPAQGQCAIVCRITEIDIETMLDAYDSGMCDTSTANCLSHALARALRRAQPVPLIRKNHHDAHLLLDELRIPVPEHALAWLAEAEIGARCRPFEFELRLPAGSRCGPVPPALSALLPVVP